MGVMRLPPARVFGVQRAPDVRVCRGDVFGGWRRERERKRKRKKERKREREREREMELTGRSGEGWWWKRLTLTDRVTYTLHDLPVLWRLC